MVYMTSVLNMENLTDLDGAGPVFILLFKLDSASFRAWALGEPLTRAGQSTKGHTLTQTITLSIGKGVQDDG